MNPSLLIPVTLPAAPTLAAGDPPTILNVRAAPQATRGPRGATGTAAGSGETAQRGSTPP